MIRRLDIEKAAQDLQRHTLRNMPRAIDRLIYLASLRDYNTGLYYHHGLASQFGEHVACQALAECHREAFKELIAFPFREIFEQLQAYQRETHTDPREFITAWKKLEPYRIAIPVESDPLLTEFLFSNLKCALALFEAHLNIHRIPTPNASPRPLLVQ